MGRDQRHYELSNPSLDVLRGLLSVVNLREAFLNALRVIIERLTRGYGAVCDWRAGSASGGSRILVDEGPWSLVVEGVNFYRHHAGLVQHLPHELDVMEQERSVNNGTLVGSMIQDALKVRE